MILFFRSLVLLAVLVPFAAEAKVDSKRALYIYSHYYRPISDLFNNGNILPVNYDALETLLEKALEDVALNNSETEATQNEQVPLGKLLDQVGETFIRLYREGKLNYLTAKRVASNALFLQGSWIDLHKEQIDFIGQVLADASINIKFTHGSLFVRSFKYLLLFQKLPEELADKVAELAVPPTIGQNAPARRLGILWVMSECLKRDNVPKKSIPKWNSAVKVLVDKIIRQIHAWNAFASQGNEARVRSHTGKMIEILPELILIFPDEEELKKAFDELKTLLRDLDTPHLREAQVFLVSTRELEAWLNEISQDADQVDENIHILKILAEQRAQIENPVHRTLIIRLINEHLNRQTSVQYVGEDIAAKNAINCLNALRMK